jgi:predicted SAM-dependent methyltransferase
MKIPQGVLFVKKFVENTTKKLLSAHVSKGFMLAVGNASREWSISRQHFSALKKVGPFLRRPEKKLNLGCGSNPKPGWINIDLFDSQADLQLDLREKWPFADASISDIYEHFELHEEIPHFLSEARRVLRPGGLFDVGVPDTEWPLRAYGDPGNQYWSLTPMWHPEWCKTQLDHINYHFRQEMEHKYAWDYETLAMTLRRFGFTNIMRREFDPALDTERRKIGTLYIRAIRP